MTAARPGTAAGQKKAANQALAARYLSLGKTLEGTAAELRISHDTIARWMKDPAFLELLDGYKAAAIDLIEPAVMANLMAALELQRQVLHGELDPGDRRYAIAHALVNRFLDRLLYVEPAPSGGASNGTFIAINNGPGNRPEDGAPPVHDADVPRISARASPRIAS